LPEVDSKTLFGGGQRVAILHRGERYWLHATRAGKLLLTK
jgi:hemin uptake protein HemP